MENITLTWDEPAVLTRKNWYIGAILATGGALSGSLGDNLVRKGHRISENWLVVVGNLCTVVLNTGFVLSAMAFADASLVIPFAGLHIFFGVVFAKVINRERLGKADWIGGVLCLVGVMLVVTAGNKDSQTYSLESIIQLCGKPAFLVYLVFDIAFTCAICVGTFLGHSPNVKKLCISVISGAFGGKGNVLAKIVIDILTYSIDSGDWNGFRRWEMYFFIVLTALTCGAQLFFLNYALSKHEAKYVVPNLNSVLLLTGTVGGAIFFEEYLRFAWYTRIFVPMGVVVALAGMLVPTCYNPTESSYSSSDEMDLVRDSIDRLSLDSGAEVTDTAGRAEKKSLL